MHAASADIRSLAISPAFERDSTVWAGTVAGVFESIDGGDTWQQVNLGLRNPFVAVLVPSPDYESDAILFAGTSAGVFSGSDVQPRPAPAPESPLIPVLPEEWRGPVGWGVAALVLAIGGVWFRRRARSRSVLRERQGWRRPND